MNFSKWHGLGNDFIIVNGYKEHIDDYAEAAIAVCNRNFGIGADGLVMVLPPQTPQGDMTMRIFNPDGSEAEMCGNASRCVAKYIFDEGLSTKKKITLDTLAGPIVTELVFGDDASCSVRVDMGEPRLMRGEIPMLGSADERAVDVEVDSGDGVWKATAVSMGNPHAGIFVDKLSEVDLPVVGPRIECLPLFPRKTNVEFVEVKRRTSVKMRVWERGAGITLACGTGAGAVITAAVLTGRTERRATVELDGGALEMEWADNNHIYMTGTATRVFDGVYLLK